MKTHITKVFNQPILIIISIFLILAGSNASLIIEAQSNTSANTRTITNNTGSSTNQPTTTPSTASSILPEPGMINAKINCAKLSSIDFSKIPDAVTKITSAAIITSSTSNSSSTCKVTGITAPNAMFVIQLPVTKWNGDFFQGGCGGLCGSLHEPAECATALGRGAAIGYSDLGHESTSMNDTSWALNENLRIEFAYHANHALALAAKQIINAFYGQEPHYSYFIGCSDGGREALMEAQRYPNDFNGIVAGAPAAFLSPLNYFKHSWEIQANLDTNGKSILTADKVSLLHNAVMKVCDSLDGVKDGLLLDPHACTFDTATLQCPNDNDAANCLTKSQVATVKKIYSGPVDNQSNYYYPGGQLYGSELGWIGGIIPSNGNAAMDKGIADSFVGYMSMPLDKQNISKGALDVRFTPQAFNSIRPMASVYDATNPNLTKFQSQGGKLIMYHGYSDPSIVPIGTLAYYNAVVKQMGGSDTAQKFVRLFMFPGVYHCGGGYGPSHFDMVTAITAWVEHGAAPDKIVATQYSSDKEQQQGPPPIQNNKAQNNNSGTQYPNVLQLNATQIGQITTSKNANQSAGQILPTGGNPNTISGEVIKTLPAYPYPLMPKYTGVGNVNDSSNYIPVPSTTNTSQDNFRWLGQDLLSPSS